MIAPPDKKVVVTYKDKTTETYENVKIISSGDGYLTLNMETEVVHINLDEIRKWAESK